SALNTLMDYNTGYDCSGFVEADNTGQENTGNVFDHDTFYFGCGIGNLPNQGGNGANIMTGGSATAGFNYSGNVVSNSRVYGAVSNGLCNGSCGGPAAPATYINDICGTNCSLGSYAQGHASICGVAPTPP